MSSKLILVENRISGKILFVILMEVYLPYDPVGRFVGWSVSLSKFPKWAGSYTSMRGV